MWKRLTIGIVCVCAAIVLAAVAYRMSSRNGIKNRDTVAASSTPASAVTQPASFSTYINPRFAFSMCYPPRVFTPQGESANGDGQKFISSDKQAVVYAYGSNALGLTISQELEQDAQTPEGVPVSVTTKNIGPNGFMFTGSLNDQTYVEKTFLENQQFKTLNIQYPTAASGTYGPIVKQMLQCFINTGPTQYSNPQ